LGVCVLHAALLESADDCFDYNACTIDYSVLQNKLAVLGENYSQELTNIILGMLNEFPDNRPDFVQLEEMLTSMTETNESLRSSRAGERSSMR
jgi:Ca2+-binding EF-hand superfamily protein